MSVVRFGDHERLLELGFVEMPTHSISYIFISEPYTTVINLKGTHWTLLIVEAVNHEFETKVDAEYQNLNDLIEVLNRSRIKKYWSNEDD